MIFLQILSLDVKFVLFKILLKRASDFKFCSLFKRFAESVLAKWQVRNFIIKLYFWNAFAKQCKFLMPKHEMRKNQNAKLEMPKMCSCTELSSKALGRYNSKT